MNVYIEMVECGNNCIRT